MFTDEPRRGEQLQRVESRRIRLARQRVARDLGEGRLGAQDVERLLAQRRGLEPTEEETGHLLRGDERGVAVHTAGHVARERLLRGALLGSGCRLRIERLDLFMRQERVVAEVASHIRIVGRQPELIERVWRRAGRVQPYRARFRLAELRARRCRDERHRQRVRFRTIHAADQLDPRRDVPPLIASPELQRHAVAPLELEEIVRLEQHVGELGVGDARIHPRAHRLLLQHVIDGEMLSDVAQEIHEMQRVQPHRVVAHARRVRPLEREESLELAADPVRVRGDLLRREQLSFCRFAARITDHPRPAPDERDRTMTEALQVHEHHDRHEASDMQAVPRRIESDVGRYRPAGQRCRHSVGVLVHQPTPSKLVEHSGRLHGTKVGARVSDCQATATRRVDAGPRRRR